MKPKIISEEPMTLVEVKEYLKKLKEKNIELGFRAAKTEEYLNQIPLLDKKTAVELKEKLESLKITRLKPAMVTKIVDLVPKTLDDLKVVLQGFQSSVSAEDMKKILSVINETVKE
ncbi:hypothetical protein DRJ19_00150 [Candidatus Woesearchaeota archaeon]|nr:MAG: hypothetical protein DRJ19_00150 [Candidatus Woesearchaeota archaeon]RLE44810.1 MAG: hypothetical protein DRJ16_01330 [Candidatus Woesearchaeota archaeon]